MPRTPARATLLTVALTIAATLLATLLVSCGREAPVQQPGMIGVFSDPAGASIFLDGVDMGLVTPDTLRDLEPGSYEVAVQLPGYQTSPTSQTATVQPLVVAPLPAFSLSRTSLAVTSTPAGAAVFLNGEDTGQTTPALLVGLDPGNAVISLQRDGFLVSPATYTAGVLEGQANEVPADTFRFRSRRTTLFEGMSNVSCAGCPEMAEDMHHFMASGEYDLDRVLYIKYSMFWPLNSDPLYQHNTPENDARMNYYLGFLSGGIPVLLSDGQWSFGSTYNETHTPESIRALAETSLAGDPGFLIDVDADFTGTTVPVTVTLTALDDVSLAGKTLVVSLVQALVEFDEAPGSEGETEFHNVFRDRADNVAALTDLGPGQTQEITTSVVRDGAWDVNDLLVIAFVQDDNDKTINQAGSTAASGAPGSAFLTTGGKNP